MKSTKLSYEIVCHSLFVCGHYFVWCGFIKVCIFYRFVWITSFFVFLSLLCFLPVLRRIRCKLYKLFNIVSSLFTYNRCQVLYVFVHTYLKRFVKTDTHHKNLSVTLNKSMPLESFWAFEFLKLHFKRKIWNIHKLKE